MSDDVDMSDDSVEWCDTGAVEHWCQVSIMVSGHWSSFIIHTLITSSIILRYYNWYISTIFTRKKILKGKSVLSYPTNCCWKISWTFLIFFKPSLTTTTAACIITNSNQGSEQQQQCPYPGDQWSWCLWFRWSQTMMMTCLLQSHSLSSLHTHCDLHISG